MRISKKPHQLIRQNEEKVRKPNKHDANLQKNSTLYFQIGLIVCLLVTYGLLEMRFEQKTILIDDLSFVDYETPEITMEEFKVYEEQAVKKEKKVEPTSFSDPEIVPNDDPNAKETEGLIVEPEGTDEPELIPDDIIVLDAPEDVPVPFTFVEKVPIYPGCEKKKNNEGRRKCMSDKINKLVRKKFDTSLGSDYGLSGVQIIRVVFKIDKNGEVSDIAPRAAHPKLEEEAKRVVSKIPKMIPGKQRDKNVSVIYQLPIKFQVQD